MKILLTRPASQAAATAALLHSFGIETCCFAVQRMGSALPANLQAATAAIFADASKLDGLIFISANAVEYGWPWVTDKLSASTPFYSVGPATTAALSQKLPQKLAFGCDIIQPITQFDSEGLLALPQLANVAQRRFIIVRGMGLTPGRDLLASTLRARGAIVDDAFCYTRTVEEPENRAFSAVDAALKNGEIGAVNVQSGETLSAFETLFAPTQAQRANLRLLVPHHRISALAVNNGYKCVEVTGVGDNCLSLYLTTLKAQHGNRT